MKKHLIYRAWVRTHKDYGNRPTVGIFRDLVHAADELGIADDSLVQVDDYGSRYHGDTPITYTIERFEEYE